MKLTHDKVRAILARLERDGQPDGCDHDCDERCDECSPLHDTQALCEEWLARHTVRWDEEEPDALRGDGWFGHVHRLVFTREWTAYSPDRASGPRTEAEARAWLEGQAREAGYEVAT